MDASSLRDISTIESNSSDDHRRIMKATIFALITQVSNLLAMRQHSNNLDYGCSQSRSKPYSQVNTNWYYTKTDKY